MRLRLLAALVLAIVGAACGARSDLVEGAGATGTGAGGSCAACVPAAGPGSPVWSRLYGSAGEQDAWSLAVDGTGNLLVAGAFQDTTGVDFGCGPMSMPAGAKGMFIAKLDPCHACVWSRAFDGASPTGIAAGPSGEVAVTGGFGGGSVAFGDTVLTGPTAFVAELDGDGAPVWAQGFGGAAASSGVTGVAVDGSGDVLVAGSFEGQVDFGGVMLPGPNGVSTFAGKLGPDGSVVWARSFGPNVTAGGVATDGAGDLLFTGNFETPVDFGCGTLEGMTNQLFHLFFAGGIGGTIDFGCGPLTTPSIHAGEVFIAELAQ